MEIIDKIIAMLDAFFNHFLTSRRSKRERFHEASKSFSDAFIEEIQLLNQGSRDAYYILQSGFEKHEKAMLEFRRYLEGRGLREFDEAWREHYTGRNEMRRISRRCQWENPEGTLVSS